MQLEERGGINSALFGHGSGCSHVILYTRSATQNHDWIKKALQGNAIVVNHLWMEHCILKEVLVRPDKRMYQPMGNGRIPDSESINICCEGYGSRQKDEIKTMVILMGATFHENWSRKVTHAVCMGLEGPMYKRAVENGCDIVNHTWLKDSLNKGVLLPCDKYCLTPERSVILTGYRTPGAKTESHNSDRLCKSTGQKRSRAQSDYSIKPDCARSLQYIEKRLTIDEYVKAEDRVVPIKYPYERTPKELTSRVLKRVLLKEYSLLAQLHNVHLSLEGNFGSLNFTISDCNERIELWDITTETLTSENRKADKEAFVDMVKRLFPQGVPPDVGVWLKNIIEGWPDALLLHHINMGDLDFSSGHFMSLYYSLMNVEKCDSTWYNNFKEAMAQYRHWYKQGFKWSILEQNKDYQDPRDLALAKYQSSSQKTKKPDPHRDSPHGALKTIENTFSHPARAHHEFFLPIVLNEDKDMLSIFQKVMYDSGYYGKRLSIKHFF